MEVSGKEYSFKTGKRNTFGAADFAIFVGTLAVSAGIGIFYAIKDRKKKNVKDFLLAGGNMHAIPVAMSLLATFISAITLLGTPAEIYNFTTMYLWIAVGYVLAIFMAAHVYLPVFYNLELTSAYEYLEKRFSRGVRTLGTCIFSLQMMVFMAIVLYGPALALNAVTGLSLWGSVITMGCVCTFYTALGGMKAVLWTDTFQAILTIAGVLAAFIQGCIEIGGFSKAWQIAADNGRLQFFDFRPYPNVRHSFWALTIGGAFLLASVYGTNQAQVQRSLTCRNLRNAQIALWMNVPGLWLILLLCSLLGIVMFAFYSTCDPLKFGLVFASDQLFPLFVMDVLAHVPGLPGLFVATIFSGSLSTMSSGLNSMAAVVLEDILKPYCCVGMTEARAALWSRALAVAFGLICLGLTWVASKLGGILQASLSLSGVLGCPLLGLFTLGILFPWANKWGAYAGLFSSLAVMLWLVIGTHLARLPRPLSPRRTDGCNWTLVNGPKADGNLKVSEFNITTTTSSILNTSLATGTLSDDGASIEDIYELSYLWYSVLAVVVVIVVGLIVSFCTGHQDPGKLDPRLVRSLCPIVCPKRPAGCLILHSYRSQSEELEEKDDQQNMAAKRRNSKGILLEPEVDLVALEQNGRMEEMSFR